MFSLSSVGFADYLSPVKDGKISRKTKKPSPYSEPSDLETAFLFYSYAIFSARKGVDCMVIYFPLSLTVAI